MGLDFEKLSIRDDGFIDEVARQLELTRDKQKAGRIISKVLHSIRDNISIDKSASILTRLPMTIKIIYVDDWHIKKHRENIYKLDDLIRIVKTCDKESPNVDLANELHALNAIISVLVGLKKHIDKNAFAELKAELPAELRETLSQPATA